MGPLNWYMPKDKFIIYKYVAINSTVSHPLINNSTFQRLITYVRKTPKKYI